MTAIWLSHLASKKNHHVLAISTIIAWFGNEPCLWVLYVTYSFSFTVKQGVTRAIADHSRTVRVPVHVHDTLGRIRKAKSKLLAEGSRASIQVRMMWFVSFIISWAALLIGLHLNLRQFLTKMLCDNRTSQRQLVSLAPRSRMPSRYLIFSKLTEIVLSCLETATASWRCGRRTFYYEMRAAVYLLWTIFAVHSLLTIF